MGKMAHRIAKKIVSKLLDNPYKAMGYDRDQIDRAFRRMKTPEAEVRSALAGWHHAKEKEREDRKYAPAAKVLAKQIREDEDERILTGIHEKLLGEGFPPGSVTMGMTPGPDPREAKLPDIYEGKTVPELRELAKDQGKTGYSKLAKADLIKLLTE